MKKFLKIFLLVVIVLFLLIHTSNISNALSQNVLNEKSTENSVIGQRSEGNYIFDEHENDNEQENKTNIIEKQEDIDVVEANSMQKSSTYVGDTTHQLLEIHLAKNSSGKGYVYGKFVFIEWIDGASTVPTKNPTVTLKSEDNSESHECFVKQEWGNTYYFDIFLDGKDFNKKYNFEVTSGNENNVSEYKKSNMKVNNQNLGEYEEYNVLIEKNELSFKKITYVGDALSELISFGINNIDKGNTYIYGNLVYVEWVNGKSTVPEKNPIVTLETEDGKVVKTLFIKQISGNTYYFDGYIDGIDIKKDEKYYIKTTSGDNKNISENKKTTLNFSSKIGKYSDYAYNVYLYSENTLKIEKIVYYGDATNEITQLSLTNNDKGYSYLYGNVVYIEWIDAKSTVPEYIPKMKLKSIDGTYEKEMFVSQLVGNTYYFDGYIEGIDVDKQYYLEMESGDFRNQSENKVTKVNFSTQKGQYKNFKYTINIDNENIISLKVQKYEGNIVTQLNDIYLTTSVSGHPYLAGTVIYVEWVNGISTVPEFTPIVRIKSTDGTYSNAMYVKQDWGNTYYFDIDVSNIDVNKQYYLEAETGDLRNTVQTKVVRVNLFDKYLGAVPKFKGDTQNNVIKFQKINYEIGTYGISGLKTIGDSRGQDLKYYKIGKGPNVMFAVFSVHGFEDQWNYDGQELTYIAEEFKNRLVQAQDMNVENKWTIYILPSVNPDGANYGWSNNGPGRLTLHSTAPGNAGIDLNRCWHISGTKYQTYSGRNYNGTAGFQANEAVELKNFLTSHQSTNGRNILVDLHGWLNETIGDSGLGAYYRNQFGMSNHINSYGTGYLVNWARASLRNCRSTLVEMPATVWSHTDVVRQNFAGKYINATLNMLGHE